SWLSFVHFDTRQAYMHDKFCIFDRKEMMTGSMNPTVSDATQNNNNLVFISSPILAANYEDEFLSLWNGKFGADDTVAIPQLLFNNFTLENYFCPEDTCEQHILDALATANTSVHFMTFSFTSDAIGDLLVKKGNSGVEISGVMEKSQNNAYSEYNMLHEKFNVSWDGNPHFLHHKVFIVDHAIVITGSMNPSKNGNEKNDENILIIHDPALAALYEEEFERLKK
ncbi:phospholipase, partial [Candidatus Woesearchaeota archaeon]|nr:phospholipase [Candidatus Woesearchaeota archaeon]